jgi:hypothetical protein
LRKVDAKTAQRRTQNSPKKSSVQNFSSAIMGGDAFMSMVKPGFIITTHSRKDSQWNCMISRRHARKKFKVETSAGKVMVSLVWDSEGNLLVEFLETGTIVNSERYVCRH